MRWDGGVEVKVFRGLEVVFDHNALTLAKQASTTSSQSHILPLLYGPVVYSHKAHIRGNSYRFHVIRQQCYLLSLPCLRLSDADMDLTRCSSNMLL